MVQVYGGHLDTRTTFTSRLTLIDPRIKTKLMSG